MEPLKIGIAGAGYISAFHLRAWSKLPNVRIVAISDPDRGRAEEKSGEFGIPAVHGDTGEMIHAEALDAIDIITPRETHAALIRAATAAGIDVLCQKPLTPTLAEAQRLAEEVEGTIRLMVHENWRFRPYYRQAGEWRREGRLGRLCQGHMTVRSSGLLPDAQGLRPALQRQPFMASEPRLIIAELLIHHLDVMRWICGEMRVVHAWADRSQADLPGETAATIVLETEEGVPVVIEGNMAAPGYPDKVFERFELIGTMASLVMEESGLRLMGSNPERVRYPPAEAYQGAFDAAIAHFVHCLITGDAFETGLTDNLRTLRLVEEAYRAAGIE